MLDLLTGNDDGTCSREPPAGLPLRGMVSRLLIMRCTAIRPASGWSSGSALRDRPIRLPFFRRILPRREPMVEVLRLELVDDIDMVDSSSDG